MVRATARLLTLCLLPLVACGDKGDPVDGEDTAGDDTGDTDDPGSDDIAWDDLHMETNKTLTACYASGAGLYVTTEDGDVFLRSAGEWTEIDIDTDGNGLNAMWGEGQGENTRLVVVGDGGTAALWESGAWSQTDVGTANIEAMSGPAVNDLMAVGWGSYFKWDGATWTATAIPTSPRFNGVWYGGAVAWAAGEDGTLARWRGTDWELWNLDSRSRMYDVSASGAGVVAAVGEAGTVATWDGSMWTEIESPTEVSLWAIDVDVTGAGILVGNNGEAWRLEAGTWTALPTGVDNNLYDVCVSPTGIAWAVGNRGAAIRLK
jgi:hypothetical protein